MGLWRRTKERVAHMLAPSKSAHPSQPPAFDATRTWQVFNAELRKPDGSAYEVFQDKAFPRWKRWVEGTNEYDGIGLRDVVNSNATFLQAVKNDLDTHKEADNARHSVIRQDIEELKAAVQAPPFPG